MRTLKYKTPLKLQNKLQEWLDIHTGNNNKYMPSIAGLVSYLGLSRTAFQNYKKLAGYDEIIEYALLELSSDIESGILAGTYRAAAGIFLLKTLGYKEARNTEDGSIGKTVMADSYREEENEEIEPAIQ